MRNSIYNDHLIKDGKKIKKVYLCYPPGGYDSISVCDCCDEMKEYASISMICGDVACICKDCLKVIINEFETN